MKVTTRAQRVAMHRLWSRTDTKCSYLKFRRQCQWYFGDYLGITWRGMFYGIELDGYTHT